jgi:hypothetical protein
MYDSSVDKYAANNEKYVVRYVVKDKKNGNKNGGNGGKFVVKYIAENKNQTREVDKLTFNAEK